MLNIFFLKITFFPSVTNNCIFSSRLQNEKQSGFIDFFNPPSNIAVCSSGRISWSNSSFLGDFPSLFQSSFPFIFFLSSDSSLVAGILPSSVTLSRNRKVSGQGPVFWIWNEFSRRGKRVETGRWATIVNASILKLVVDDSALIRWKLYYLLAMNDSETQAE